MGKYVRFERFFAPWWSADPTTLYYVHDLSYGGALVKLNICGTMRWVPVDVLMFEER